MFRFWDYQITFKDPAAVYSYHLIGVHHSVIWYLIIILILVYYWLLMIVRDFSWESFNRSQGVSSFSIFFSSILNSIKVYPFIAKFHKDFIDIKFLCWLGVETNEILYFIADWYLKINVWFVGTQSTSFHEYDSKLIDITGRVLFDDEIFLFDMETHLIRESMSSLFVNDDIDNDNISFEGFSINEPFFSVFANSAAIEWYSDEKLVNCSLYHYTSPAFFFNGYVDRERFFLRKVSRLDNNSDFGLRHVLSLVSSSQIKVNTISSSTMSQNFNILPDTLFESFDFKHSLSFEFIWALFPTTIIISILIPSLYLLYSLDEDLDPKLTIKVIGNQWYWSYEFNNWVEISNGEVAYWSYKFDSNLITTDNLEFGTKRLLEVDRRLVVPINVTLRFLITAGDVLHSWAVPELGIKIDAVPGRLNQFLSFISQPGVFYGQCSEICGANHGFMPIVVVGVPYSVFVEYLQTNEVL